MKKIKAALICILCVHITALFFMTLQRVALLLSNTHQLADIDNTLYYILSSFIRGLWFDNVIASYITFLPLIFVSVMGMLNRTGKWMYTTLNTFFILIYLVVFTISFADIPYFNYFYKHLNSSIFNWYEDDDTALNMIFQESSYYIYMILFAIVVISFSFIVIFISSKLLSKPQSNIKSKDLLKYIPVCLLLIALCFLGVRGRLGYNPIRTSQAYFCNNTFFNQLGINPVFYFMRDVIESSKKHLNVQSLVSEHEAIKNVRKELGLNPDLIDFSPVYREVTAIGEAKKMNVVVILLESMSADLLKINEKGKTITPFLHELINKSYYFENFYSAGNHTNHGIIATLYGLPALFDKNMMKNVDTPLCQGLPNTLQRDDYNTLFFISHEAQYDNMNAFLLENGIEEVYSEEDYPKSKVVNCFGVADDSLLEYTLNKLNEKAELNKTFFATVLTISNHPPYIVPEPFVSVSDDPQYQIVAFADNALKDFFAAAEKQSWYDNTLFVLLGDHGKMVGTQTYEMPLSYNHIPCIIYSPTLKDAPKRFDQVGGQIDIFPTVMGLLNRSYKNNTFGIDLLKEKRPYMFFSSDEGLGCIDKEFYYTYNINSKMEGLYKYASRNPENYFSQYTSRADSMKIYSTSMFQVANFMMENKLTRIEE